MYLVGLDWNAGGGGGREAGVFRKIDMKTALREHVAYAITCTHPQYPKRNPWAMIYMGS